MEGKYLSIIKVVYKNPTVTSYSRVKKLKAFFLSSGTRQGCPLSPRKFNIVLKTTAS